MSDYNYNSMKKSLRAVPARTRLSEENLILMGIPQEFWNTSLDELSKRHDDSIFKVVNKYVNNIHDNYEKGIGIFFFGSNGVGKTELSSVVGREAYRRRYTVKFTTMNKLTPLGVKAGYDEDIKAEYYSYYLNVDLLIVDEVGKEQEGEKKANITILEEVLRHRNMRMLPSIVVTNLKPEDFRDRYGESIYSLIFARFIDIKMVGEDKRKTVRHNEVLGRSK